MAFDYDTVKNWPFPEVEHTYTEKDSILYALGLGYGADPMDENQLQFVFEEPELVAVPTMAVVLAIPGFWMRDPKAGVDWVKLLHGEQGLVVHKPLPAAATVTAQSRITQIIDKGPDKGALVYIERTVTDKASGDALATVSQVAFCRGDGGCGGPPIEQPKPHALPDRGPDTVVEIGSVAQAALIYRLSGDPNPLHASPKVAKAAGFDMPILHGLCTYGIAGHAVLKEYCGYDASKLRGFDLRFSAPVYPGETISTEMWRDGDTVSFRSRSVERDVVVLNNGKATVI
jgi:acyl dehydratase